MKQFLALATLVALTSLHAPLWAASTPQVPSDLGSATSPQAAALPVGALESLAPSLLLDEPGDGRTWARGPQWKASFGLEGLTYIPFFGSDAPKNYPVEFDLESVSSAGQTIELGQRTRSRTGSTVQLDRGSVQEVYHLTKDTVEQTFVFQSLPNRGELVLDLTVKTELVPQFSPRGGFDYCNELGTVHYGRAFAVDASGMTVELEQTLTENGIRISVPRDFVGKSELPLTVDPVITTFPITNNTRRQIDLDVSYDSTSSISSIVYSELQSAFDSDVIVVDYNPSIDTVVATSSIDITSASWGMPRSASNYDEGQFLCVSVVGNTIGSRRVWGRTRMASTGVRGLPFQISGVGAETVDVGGWGRDSATSYDYMVVWQESDSINQDFDIVAQAVNSNGSLTGGRIVIDGDVGDYDTSPTISKSSGARGYAITKNEYMIVWEREVGPDDRNLRAQVIEYDGSMVGHNQFNVYTFSDSIHPDVSSSSSHYTYNGDFYWMVAFERRVGSVYKIFTVIARDGSADNARNVHTMRNLDVDLDHRNPKLANGDRDFNLTFQTESPNGDRQIHFTGINAVHDGGELRTGLHFRNGSLGISHQAPAVIAVASAYDGGNSHQNATFLPVWIAEDAAGDPQVSGAEINADLDLARGSQYCAAEVNSSGEAAWMNVAYSHVVPSSTMDLVASDLPPNVFGFFLVGTQAGFILNPGGSEGHLCIQGAVGRFNRAGEILFSGTGQTYSVNVDSTAMPSPGGIVSAQPGETWYFQSWFRDNGAQSNFTNAVEVTFD
ncbi:MAG: hypothetical protein P1V35_09035 [Planctomycetota bacterium]|nr:hypothetical protein [Planctomycetota bacterium]